MEIEYQEEAAPRQPFERVKVGRHRLVIRTSRDEVVEGKWVAADRTPVISYANRRYAWIGGHLVSADPIGKLCDGCQRTGRAVKVLLHNSYCNACADAKHERNIRREEAEEERKAIKRAPASLRNFRVPSLDELGITDEDLNQ